MRRCPSLLAGLVVLLSACATSDPIEPLPTDPLGPLPTELPTAAPQPSVPAPAATAGPSDAGSAPAVSQPAPTWELPDGDRDRSDDAVAADLRGLDDGDVVLRENWSEPGFAVRPFELPAMTGGASSMGTYEIVVTEPDTVALADVRGLGDDGPDLALGVATAARFFGGRESAIALGLYCWDDGARDDGPQRTSSRYEMALVPDGDQQRLVVLRRSPDADATVMLIDEPVDVPADESARMVLGCRRAGDRAEIVAGATSADDDGAPTYVAAVDPDPLPAGGGAGLLTATAPGPDPGEVAVFGELTVFDAKRFEVE